MAVAGGGLLKQYGIFVALDGEWSVASFTRGCISGFGHILINGVIIDSRVV